MLPVFVTQAARFMLGAIFWSLVFSVTHANALDLTESKHLLDRTSFGMSLKDAERLSPLSREQAVELLIEQLGQPDKLAAPPFISAPRPDYWGKDWESSQTVLYRVSEINQLQAWWLQEMIETDRPFAEKLALFWHNHFVSRFDPGRVSAPFYEQLAIFRGPDAMNLRQMLRATLRDPMMLTSLDNVHNTKSRPNENLARELLELFTLGIGNYTEADIKEAARVLAGHGVNREAGWIYQLDTSATDRGPKTVLGSVISPGSDDDLDALIEIILAKPQVSKLIATKFYAEFVSVDVDRQEVDRLAEILRRSDFDMRPFLRALFLSDAFWSERNRAGLVKSPIELIVGFMRSFELHFPDQGVLLDYLARLGQSPFMAPSVAGWRGGTEWLTIKSIEERGRIVRRLWSAYDDALRQRPSDNRDLFIRFSSEQLDTPASLIIEADGQVVAETTARQGLKTYEEKASNEPGGLKPMWETFSVARASLPQTVKTVTVRLGVRNPDTRLFVNWISLDGYRLSPAKAVWVLDNEKICSGDAPKGMFYCNLGLSFPVETLGPQRVAMDDLSGPHNSIIEFGTGRLQLAGSTVGNAPTVSDFSRNFSDYIGRLAKPQDGDAVSTFLLTTRPLYRSPMSASSALDPLSKARMLTDDPAYNLK